MKSMTGFGSSHIRTDAYEIEVSVKSVNGRFLEVRFHLPREYHFWESELRKLIVSNLRRGTVDVYITRRLGPKASAVHILSRKSLAKEWLQAYRGLGKELGLPGEARLETLVTNLDVLHVDERPKLMSGEKPGLIRAVNQAVKKCCQERQREGRGLKKELSGHFSQLQKKTLEMGKLRGQANKELKKRYLLRLEKVGFNGVVDDQRMAQEIAIQLDKVDVNEELSRVTEHLKKCKQLLPNGGAHGKKLDFYSQELLREMNTIGSKSQLAKLTQLVVDAKTLIEQVREQVQNIE